MLGKTVHTSSGTPAIDSVDRATIAMCGFGFFDVNEHIIIYYHYYIIA